MEDKGEGVGFKPHMAKRWHTPLQEVNYFHKASHAFHWHRSGLCPPALWIAIPPWLTLSQERAQLQAGEVKPAGFHKHFRRLANLSPELKGKLICYINLRINAMFGRLPGFVLWNGAGQRHRLVLWDKGSLWKPRSRSNCIKTPAFKKTRQSCRIKHLKFRECQN